jgi:hypothetical protein
LYGSTALASSISGFARLAASSFRHKELFSPQAFHDHTLDRDSQEKTFAEWRPLAIDALTVAIYDGAGSTSGDFLVTVPVAWWLDAGRRDINTLIGAIAGRCFLNFRELTVCLEAIARGVKFFPEITWHKKEAINVDGTVHIVERCGSDRPAFSMFRESESTKEEICHFYAAMGLARQHSFQQACLAVVKDQDLALSLCVAAAAYVGTTQIILGNTDSRHALE